jgi:hypothetical protein
VTLRAVNIEKVSQSAIAKFGLAQKGLPIHGICEGDLAFSKPS